VVENKMILQMLRLLLLFHGPQPKEKDIGQAVRDCTNNPPGFEAKVRGGYMVCELVNVSEKTLRNPPCQYMRQGTYMQHEAGGKYHLCDREKIEEEQKLYVNLELPRLRVNFFGEGPDKDML